MKDFINIFELNNQFNKDLDAFINKTFTGREIVCGYPSDILIKCGLPFKKIIINPKTLREKWDTHLLKKQHLIDLPLELFDPVLILNYPKIPNTVNVFISKLNHEGLILISIRPLKNELNINKIVTVHGNNIEQLINRIIRGELIWGNVKKIKDLFIGSGVNSLKSEKVLNYIANIQHFSTESQEKNNTTLGAVEILNQNGKELDFNGMQPTYVELQDYSHLISAAEYTERLEGEGFEQTLSKIKEVTQKYHHQVARLAKHLFSANEKQAAFNTWHWIVTNLKYNFDTQGKEEIRTPARSYRDGNKKFGFVPGIDCEDMAVFAYCLLMHMGYKPKYNIVAFNNKQQYGHIYTVLTDRPAGIYATETPGIVIDGVMTKFNVHPDFITKTLVMEGIPVSVLRGTEKTNILIMGLGGMVTEADSVTMHLLGERERLLKAGFSGLGAYDGDAELRKIQTMVMLNGTYEREILLGAMPYIKDINQNGHYVFESEEIGRAVEDYFNEADSFVNGLALDGLGDLGKKKKKLKEFIKNAGDKLKNTAKNIATAAKKVVKNIVRFNPLTIAARNGLLVVMKLNIFNLAYKLAPGYLTEAQAQAEGYDMTEWRKLKEQLNRTIKLFTSVGGKEENLKREIIRGSERRKKRLVKKAGRQNMPEAGEESTNELMVNNTFISPSNIVAPNPNLNNTNLNTGEKLLNVKAGRGIPGRDVSGLFGIDDIDGLGEPVSATTATTAASGLIAAIKAWLSKINFKKLFQFVKGVFGGKKADELAEDKGTAPSEIDLSPGEQSEILNLQTDAEGKAGGDNYGADEPTGKNNNTLFIVLGIAAAAAVAAVAMGGKKGKK